MRYEVLGLGNWKQSSRERGEIEIKFKLIKNWLKSFFLSEVLVKQNNVYLHIYLQIKLSYFDI